MITGAMIALLIWSIIQFIGVVTIGENWEINWGKFIYTFVVFMSLGASIGYLISGV